MKMISKQGLPLKITALPNGGSGGGLAGGPGILRNPMSRAPKSEDKCNDECLVHDL